jgi:hypothetical protein
MSSRTITRPAAAQTGWEENPVRHYWIKSLGSLEFRNGLLESRLDRSGGLFGGLG